MSDDTEAVPAERGFWCGLDYARMDYDPQPPNPYPLRTEERARWSKGYVVGRALGASQQEHARQMARVIRAYPDGGTEMCHEH